MPVPRIRDAARGAGTVTGAGEGRLSSCRSGAERKSGGIVLLTAGLAANRSPGRGVLQERGLFSRNPGRTPCRRGTAFRTPAGGKRGFFRSRADGSSVSPLPEGSSPAHGPCPGCGLSLPVGRRGVKLMLRLSCPHTTHTLSCGGGRVADVLRAFPRAWGIRSRLFSFAAFSGMPPSIFLKRNPAFRLWGRARDHAFVGKRRAEASVFYMFLLR